MKKILLTVLMTLSASAVSQAAMHDVTIMNFAFIPADLTVSPGDTVRWTNNDAVPHTSTSDTGVWDSGTLQNGDTYTLSLSDPGDFPYHCNIHPSMLGSITVTNPGGGNGQWEMLNSGVGVLLNDVIFANSDMGWIAGDTGLLRTTDGGDNWSFFATPEDMEAIYFIDTNQGWASGNDGYIVHTTDAGVTWSPQTSGFGDKLRDIRMADASNGWAVGRDGAILHTTNGGMNWASQPNPATDDLRGIAIMSGSEAWVSGSDGVILHTTNSGQNWIQVTSGTNEELKAIFFLNSTTAWACGGTGVMLKSTNGGASWSPQNTNISQDLFDVFFVDAGNGWAVGDGGSFIRSTDGGASWGPEDPGVTADWRGIFFVSSALGFAVGSNGSVVRYASATSIADDPVSSNLPSAFVLGANYPNPFNPGTNIPFSIKQRAAVTLEVFDLTGRSLGTIFKGAADAGRHSVYWDAQGLATGVYFYRLSVGNETQTRRMIYLK